MNPWEMDPCRGLWWVKDEEQRKYGCGDRDIDLQKMLRPLTQKPCEV